MLMLLIGDGKCRVDVGRESGPALNRIRHAVIGDGEEKMESVVV